MYFLLSVALGSLLWGGSYRIDAGEIVRPEIKEIKISVVNEDLSKDLQIERGLWSCPCFRGEIQSRSVAPGKSTEYLLSLESAEEPDGSFSKSVYLITNQGRREYKIEGIVRAPRTRFLILTPLEWLLFRNEEWGKGEQEWESAVRDWCRQDFRNRWIVCMMKGRDDAALFGHSLKEGAEAFMASGEVLQADGIYRFRMKLEQLNGAEEKIVFVQDKNFKKMMDLACEKVPELFSPFQGH